MRKRIISLILAVANVLCVCNIIPATVYAKSINDSDVFLTQQTSYTCTLTSAAMMLRRRAILDGEDWSAITESSLKGTAWVEDVGLRYSFTYQDKSVAHGYFSNVVNELVSMLSVHPEGVVAYNTSQPHAVLITDYDSSTGNFYCADPMLSSGRIPVASSTLNGSDLLGKMAGLTAYWYITNRSGGSDDTTAPTISNVRVTDKTKDGYTVRCHVEDDVGVDRVLFPTWYDGQTAGEVNWLNSTNEGNGEYSCRINVSDFGKTEWMYYTHIYAYDTSNNYVCYENTSVYIDATAPTISNVRVTEDKEYKRFGVRCHVEDNVGVSEIYYPTWRDGQSYENDAKWLPVMDQGDNEYLGWIGMSEFDYEEGVYTVRICAWDEFKNTVTYDVSFTYEKIPFEVTNNGTSADITNNGEERTVTVIVADCSSSGVLEDVTASDITFAAGEKRTFMLGSGTHKVFVWDSLNGMKPLAEVE